MWNDEPDAITNWDDAILAAAKAHVPCKKNTPKKPWIIQETSVSIKTKHALEHSSNEAGYKQARKNSAKAAKKDWETWLAKIVDVDLELRD